jgi:SHS family lactate transporter-like MFS transporter
VVVGRYSDLVGRRRAMITALLLAIALVPLWAYVPSTVPLLIGAFLLQFMVQGAWGVVPAHINELSPDTVRGFLPGFAYQCGTAVGGWITVIQDALKDQISYASAMAVTAATAFTLAAIVVSLGREQRAVEFGVVPAE